MVALEHLHYDVVIVGAGIVGGALACALADSSLRVAVIEARSLPTIWPPRSEGVSDYDARVSALTLASRQWLQQLCVWDDVVAERVCAYRQMHVWDADGVGAIDFNAAEVGQVALGHIVENRLVAIALAQQLTAHQRRGHLNLYSPNALTEFQQQAGGGHLLQLDNGEQISTTLVVAADGALSPLRQRCGFEMREWDYGHHAIVTTVQIARPHQHTAWQRFMPEGPLAFLPLAGGDGRYCSIVWSTLPERAEALMALSADDFADALSTSFERCLGDIEQVGERHCVSLRQRHAVNYIKPGIALVGDAAHTIHPLAGQGLNLGLMDARVLAEELLRAERRQLSVGERAVLGRYQRRRKAANLSMMAGMEGFKRLFENPQLPLRWARNTGMRWVSDFTPLKQQLIRSAMGL